MTGYCKQDVLLFDTKELCFKKGKEYEFTTKEECGGLLESGESFGEFDDVVSIDETGDLHWMTLGFYNRHFSTI
jgi:hypothetical protein